MELQPGTNTGVLIRPPSPTDWVAGGETGISAVTLEPSGQYDVYLPEEEPQSYWDSVGHILLDTSACVTFSATNNIEILINRIRARGEMPATHEAFLKNEGYINPQSGKVNFSDRFTAKMSGTTRAGNYLDAVGDSIRKLHGLLPERDWPCPDMSDIPGNENLDARWDRYYTDIPQALQDKAMRFLTYFTINRQWNALGTSTPSVLRDDLKRGPFQIAAAVCPPWSSNDGMPPIQSCGCTSQHATLIYGYRDTDMAFKDFDHYKSYRKLLAENYCIPWAVQYAVFAKSPTPTNFQYTYNINLKFGMPAGPEVRALQKGLQTVRDPEGKPYMTPGTFGPFGPATKLALGRFQTAKGITDPQGQGTNFGPQSRAALTNALK